METIVRNAKGDNFGKGKEVPDRSRLPDHVLHMRKSGLVINNDMLYILDLMMAEKDCTAIPKKRVLNCPLAKLFVKNV